MIAFPFSIFYVIMEERKRLQGEGTETGEEKTC